jgi:CHAT domain
VNGIGFLPLTAFRRVQTAWLDFSSAQHIGKSRPVPAGEVASLLVASGIKCAVLNACDSARTDQGIFANLAITFLEKGLSNVLAMSYEFARSAIGPCFTTFYDVFLRQGSSFSNAAQEARASLMTDQKRNARFGLDVEVKDWFIPVSYTSGRDEIVSYPRTGDLAIHTDNYNRMIFTEMLSDNRLIGRDYDTLRLEQTILQSDTILVHGPAGVGKSVFAKYALDIWGRTNLFPRQSFIDLQERLILETYSGLSILEQICDDLKLPHWFLGLTVSSDVSISTEEHDKLHLDDVVIVLDNIQTILNKYFTAGLQDMVNAVKYVLRRFSSNILTDSQSHGVKFILTARNGKDWFEDRCKLISPEYFELSGLELPDALSFLDTVLRKNGIILPKRTRRDTDFQVHIVNLLQRIPLAISIACPKPEGPVVSLEEAFRALLVGVVPLNFGAIESRSDFTLILSLKDNFHRFPEFQDELCSIADFWTEGPLRLTTYFRKTASYAGIHYEFNNEKLILPLNEMGVWKVTKDDDLVWIHPLLTLYLRQHRQRHSFRGPPLWAKGIMKVTDFISRNKRTEAYGSNAALKAEIPQHFTRSVAFRSEANMLVDAIMMSTKAGMNAPLSGATMRTSLFNVLSALDMVCREDSPIPMEQWPRDLFVSFLAPSRLFLSKPESELTTSYIEVLLGLFINKIGGFSVPPEYRVFALNIVIHLLTVSVCGGIYNAQRTEELVTIGLAMVESSEAEYGAFKGSELMWKAMMYRFEAVYNLLKKDEEAADKAWEKMKAVELAHFGPSAFEPSTPNAGMGLSMSPLQNATQPFGANIEKAVASWVPLRHAAWPYLKEQVLQKGNTGVIDRMYMPGIESAFEDMVNTHKQAGWKSLDHWKHYFPPRNDLNSYIQQLQDPNAHLQGLEEALDRGDWKVAGQAHFELMRKAMASHNMDQAEFHFKRLTEIFDDVGVDNTSIKQIRGGMKLAQLGMKVQQNIMSIDDNDCLELVTAMEDCGITDIAAAYRAQGLPEIFSQIILQGAERARRGEDNLADLIPWELAAKVK